MKALCVKILSEVGWLATQSAEFRSRWLDICNHRTYAPGEHLYSLGDPPGGVYGLAQGFADVSLTAGPFPPYLAYIARAGWWVGEAAAVTQSARRVEVRARTELQVLYVEPGKLKRLAEEDPEVWHALSQLTVSHLDNALAHASSLMKGDPRLKILATLIRLAGPACAQGTMTYVPCSQQELGEMVGLSRNSVGPTLKRLEQEGPISRDVYGEIAYNPVRLNQAMLP